MYKAIRQHPPVSEVYARRLVAEGKIDEGFAAAATKAFTDHLEEEFEAAKTYKSNHADWFAGRWSGLHQPAAIETARKNVETAISGQMFDSLGRTLTTIPDGHEVHKTLRRVIEAKAEMFKTGEGIDWATGEALAFGSLLSEGYGVRLSGQDSGRGGPVPVAIQTFAETKRRQTADEMGDPVDRRDGLTL